MKFNLYILFFLLTSGYANTQTLSEYDEKFIDSLKSIDGVTVFTLEENCYGCERGALDGFGTDNEISCGHSNNSWTVWIFEQSGNVFSRMTNGCYDLTTEELNKYNTLKNFIEFYNELITDSIAEELQIPIIKSEKSKFYLLTSYTITKYEKDKKYYTKFSKDILYPDSGEKTTEKIDKLLREIMAMFEEKLEILGKEGDRIEENWE